MGWGVSNVVLRVDVEGHPPIILKQSREQLRTKARWVSRLERIWTEAEALRLLATVLPAGVVPEVLFEDRDNYLFAMSCAPEGSAVWKEQLLLGKADPDVARRAGEILGRMHGETLEHPALEGLLADRTVFHELRIDPFYETVRRAHPDLDGPLSRLIDEVDHPPEIRFVHADFSPKNLLVRGGEVVVVDFETAHAGDPAFDLGFFASHLILKAIRGWQGLELVRAGDGPMLGLLRTFADAYWANAGQRSPGRPRRSGPTCTRRPAHPGEDRRQEPGRLPGRSRAGTSPVGSPGRPSAQGRREARPCWKSWPEKCVNYSTNSGGVAR